MNPELHQHIQQARLAGPVAGRGSSWEHRPRRALRALAAARLARTAARLDRTSARRELAGC